MPQIEKYRNVEDAYSYSDAFTVRFPLGSKKGPLQPLVDYIDTLSTYRQTYHHSIYGLKYLNAIFDYRYIKTHYSFVYALEEYDYMMES